MAYVRRTGLRFDDQGMLLPHSILGSLEDFRSYLEAKGETELVKCIPKSSRYDPFEDPGRRHPEAVESGHGIPSGHRNIQSNALQHWDAHMTQRRQQQDFLSDLLDRPVENLLMSQTNHFRETQQKKEVLNRVTPLIHSGYGHRVGSEFWSLPQRYGDETSGIAATLTQTEQGRREPVTHVGQPSSIRQESGISCAETLRLPSRTWDLQHQRQELGEVLGATDIKQPEISGLEVIGSSLPDAKLVNFNLDKKHLNASWHLMALLSGEIASSQLELHNEGSTAIYYSWEQLPMTNSFPNLITRTKSVKFYFNSSSGVICPGVTQQVEIIFKSEGDCIHTELWQLNTHPLLLQGASMQVTLRGVALYQDKTAAQRLFIQTELDERVKKKMRPSSPAELYVTEEQEFLSQNPGLSYHHQPVEELKRLWQEVHPEGTWDFSVHTLRQVVLSLREQESVQERSLAQLNSLFLQLSEPSQLNHLQLTPAAVGQHLWRKLLDTMDAEAVMLRNQLGLPQKDTWSDKKEEAPIADADVADNKDGKCEKKGGAAATEGRSRASATVKDDNTEKPVQVRAEKASVFV
ncbi:MYCBP-associated protein-like [Lycodopsis pacificus]